jgi:hypothetical protein
MVAFLTGLAFGPARFLGDGHLGQGYVDALARLVCLVLVTLMVAGALGVGVARAPRHLAA